MTTRREDLDLALDDLVIDMTDDELATLIEVAHDILDARREWARRVAERRATSRTPGDAA